MQYYTYTIKYALQIIYYDIYCVCVIYGMASRIMHAPNDWSFKHEKKSPRNRFPGDGEYGIRI